MSLFNRRGPNSSLYTRVPGFWDKTAIPDSGYQVRSHTQVKFSNVLFISQYFIFLTIFQLQRVFLDPSHKDYIRVQDNFNKTMKDFDILTIERIQNKELWEDFQT